MSSDDRTDQLRASDDEGRANARPPLRGDGARSQPPRPSAPSGTTPPRSRWQVDPEEVDRYLAERARAASANAAPTAEPSAEPSPTLRPPAAPDPTLRPPVAADSASPRTSSRSASFGASGRSRRPLNAPRRQEAASDRDPFAADEWSDILDDSWQTPEVAAASVAEPAVSLPSQRRPRQSARARAQARGGATRTVRPLAMPKLVLPAAVRRADFVHDRPALLLLGVAGVSAAAMAAVMATRLGGVEAFIPVHLDAAGQPDRWGPRRSLWALPLMAIMIPVVNAALGSIGAGIDHFARRFLLATALLVQLLAWVAVLRLL